jgi:hypothetical protein
LSDTCEVDSALCGADRIDAFTPIINLPDCAVVWSEGAVYETVRREIASPGRHGIPPVAIRRFLGSTRSLDLTREKLTTGHFTAFRSE